VRITFNDGAVREVDFTKDLERTAARWLSRCAIRTTSVRSASMSRLRTLVWPNGMDADPDVLHGDRAPAGSGCVAVRQLS